MAIEIGPAGIGPGGIGPGGSQESLRETPLADLHRELGARMVPFAGYLMPVQYPAGIIAEHNHCRSGAALFDVSHMGQAWLDGPDPAAALETLVPGDIAGLRAGRQRYTLLTNPAGGILDDLMVARLDERLLLVVNAARKEADYTHLRTELPEGAMLAVDEDRALLALQGPKAAEVLGRLDVGVSALPFLGVGRFSLGGVAAIVSRSGYTGEDGFELSVTAGDAEGLARRLLGEMEVAPAGLGARDSLRLEAGLCLYGQDIDELTSPVEAGLTWTIGKRRRLAWDFPGAEVMRDQLDIGPTRMRVGILPEGRAPVRAGAEIVAEDGTRAGTVTSGGFSPSTGRPVAMGYVRRDLAADGTALGLALRGRTLPAHVAPLPFVAPRTHSAKR